MKKKSLIAAAITGILTVGFITGCGSQADTEKTEGSSEETITESASKETINEQVPAELAGCYLITNVYGDGQKPWIVVLEYSVAVDASSASVSDFSVEGYDIENVYVNTEPQIPEENTDGTYVLLELSTDYTTTGYGGTGSTGTTETNRTNGADFTDEEEHGDFSTEEISGFGTEEMEDSSREIRGFDDSISLDGNELEEKENADRNDSLGSGQNILTEASNQLSVTVTQIDALETTDGVSISAMDDSITTDYTENDNLLVKNFTQDTFTASDGTTLMYSIYLPDDYGNGSSYPVVLFMPDATGEGNDEYRALTESLGGVIWTEDSWQEEHPCIVLVPQYEDSNGDNPIYTMALLYDIIDNYAVNENRIYLVGQSSGTIRAIKLLEDYPDTFAGGMLVAGQADGDYADRLAELAGQHIWMIASEGDERAYPGMQAIVDAVESAGTPVCVAQWSADLSDEEQENLAMEQKTDETTIKWTIYDAGTVMEDDVAVSAATEHMNTWRVAYRLDTVREWLFEQETE